MSARRWKDRLADRISPSLGEEIDVFETQMALRKDGKLDDKVFAETRLRRGAYGQRYDNGQRHDGEKNVTLSFPTEATKGPDTQWDAPGMMRLKIPMGKMTPEQLDVVAELAEEYSDRILHVTTRQDVQLHFVHIEDTPDLQRRLAAVGMTTREACGNSVRNITACQYAGTCAGQAFDVTPYADALTQFLLGHKDIQDFGRKMKIAFSGCAPEPCGVARFHDIGAIAEVRDGKRGFQFLVGGGLGAVPHQAKVLYDFVPEEELLPLSQAVCRIFSQLGERKNRARARLKFVVQKLGLEEFRNRVEKEREKLPHDPRWTAYLEQPAAEPQPLKAGASLGKTDNAALEAWRASNCRPQVQEGYVVATVRLPLGDITSRQARALANMARRYGGDDSICLTVEQNIAFRWISQADLPAFYADLERLGLAQAGASEIGDIVACPGTDTCKLGISASRGLAGVLEKRLAQKTDLHPDVKKLRIKASGCFNSCSQHHVADIGFLGVSRNVGGRRVSHFQLVVGGEMKNNGGAYGLAVGAFPAKRIPDVVDRVTAFWVREREVGETLQNFIQRVGRAKLKKECDDLRHVPGYDEDKSFYTDWGDAREYTIGDIGVGECAGEVVDYATFGLTDAEREVFEAQLQLESGDAVKAAETAYQAMLTAAKALVRVENVDVTDAPDDIVSEFRTRLHDTKVFHDPFAGAKFAMYLLRTHESPPANASEDVARERIEEAQLFVEAAHGCYDRMQERAQGDA